MDHGTVASRCDLKKLHILLTPTCFSSYSWLGTWSLDLKIQETINLREPSHLFTWCDRSRDSKIGSHNYAIATSSNKQFDPLYRVLAQCPIPILFLWVLHLSQCFVSIQKEAIFLIVYPLLISSIQSQKI